MTDSLDKKKMALKSRLLTLLKFEIWVISFGKDGMQEGIVTGCGQMVNYFSKWQNNL